MARTPKRSALVPAAARAQTTLSEAEQDLSAAAIDTFAAAIGGKAALVEALCVADSAPEVDQIVTLLLDPRYDAFSLRRLCGMAGLTIADLFAAYKKAAIVRAHIASATIIAKTLPPVVEDVMRRAAPYECLCQECRGTGTTVPEPTTDQPNPSPQVCAACFGHGKVLVEPDLDRQKLALDLGDLVKKGGGILIQANQQVIAPGAVGTGSLEQLQQAVSEVLFGSAGATSLVDVTPAPATTLEPPPHD